MKKVLLILITILLLTGCSSKNETTEEIITTKPVVDKKEKLTEAENILLNYGKLIYETEEWQNVNLEIKTYETTLKEMNEVNGFDIDTCRGMQQVQEISDASIMKQLALDESEWSDMVAEMRVVNTGLRKEKDAYQEINRILLRENLDLRDTLKENNLLNEEQLKDLKYVYSVFAEFDEVEESPDDETKEVTENESE